MRKIRASIGGRDAVLEVAESREEKEIGFMFRENVEPDSGIVFVYEEDVQDGFWMKNVSIPLSIAFLDENQSILEVMNLNPGDETIRTPSRPYRYAVEMRRGWFDENCRTAECEIPFRQNVR